MTFGSEIEKEVFCKEWIKITSVLKKVYSDELEDVNKPRKKKETCSSGKTFS